MSNIFFRYCFSDCLDFGLIWLAFQAVLLILILDSDADFAWDFVHKLFPKWN